MILETNPQVMMGLQGQPEAMFSANRRFADVSALELDGAHRRYDYDLSIKSER